ncbi:MAG: nuclear transport factor 2 family protein [Armatimonadetes bacterium]|nr:nuclear transport factor 2 family protein [Armatimonadota bacterium]
MSEQDNVRLIQEIYAAFGRGDVSALLEMLAPDVEWLYDGPDTIPWGGHRSGREEAARFFSSLAESVDVKEFGVHEFIAQADKVVAVGHEKMHVKATGRSYLAHWAHVFTVRDGKVARFREYTDTAAVAAAV